MRDSGGCLAAGGRSLRRDGCSFLVRPTRPAPLRIAPRSGAFLGCRRPDGTVCPPVPRPWSKRHATPDARKDEGCTAANGASLSRVEAAALCGVSPNTFDRMQADGLMPRPKRVYGRVLWDVRALDAAIDRLPGETESPEDEPEVNEWDFDLMPDMLRRPPKYVQGFADRHGKVRWYFRRRGYPLTPLPGLPWSPDFMAAYERAAQGEPMHIGRHRSKPGTVDALIASYYRSADFTQLAEFDQARPKEHHRTIPKRSCRQAGCDDPAAPRSEDGRRQVINPHRCKPLLEYPSPSDASCH